MLKLKEDEQWPMALKACLEILLNLHDKDGEVTKLIKKLKLERYFTKRG